MAYDPFQADEARRRQIEAGRRRYATQVGVGGRAPGQSTAAERAASDAAFTARRNALFTRNATGYTPDPAAQSAAIARTQTNFANTASQFKEPIEAGTLGGNRVQVTGPNSIRTYLPFQQGYGERTINTTTAAGGEPIDAHLYLHSHPDFKPTDDYAKQFMAAAERSAGVEPKPQPTVEPSAGGPVLARGGVSTPVENLTPAERIQYGVATPWDTLTSSPASLAVRGAAGRAGTAVVNAAKSVFGLGPSSSEQAALAPRGVGVPAPTPRPTPEPITRLVPPKQPLTYQPPTLGLTPDSYGGATAAGVSNKQAATFQTPTQASPIPKTPTSPAADINKTLLTTQPEGAGSPTPTPTPGTAQARSPATQAIRPGSPSALPDDWENRRYAYEGF
jgi:hypothetical protein